MKVFHAGLPAWKKAGNLVVSGPVGLETWMKAGEPFVLVDLRDPEAAAKGFIPGAIGIPAKDLAAWKERFPENKKAPIVIYDGAQAGAEAFKTVRGWGYVNATVLVGGITSWKGELATGALAAPAKIEYTKKLKPGEITIEEFRKIADTRPADTLILDVREQPVDGVLVGALPIPESQIKDRFAEVPKEKTVVIHCNTGILAKNAYDLLVSKGYKNVRWLNAVIVVGANGAYEVTEK
ncbi:MAG TPA: rhodanese-like domain-containing protein [bacterium]